MKKFVVALAVLTPVLAACGSAGAAVDGLSEDATPVMTGSGTWEVGSDMDRGTYIAVPEGPCTWSVQGPIAADDIGVGQMVVDVRGRDISMTADGSCGDWYNAEDVVETIDVPTDGTWLVGDQIEPGTYEFEGDLCRWERRNDYNPDQVESLIDIGGSNDASNRVTIEKSDWGFASAGCTWTRVD